MALIWLHFHLMEDVYSVAVACLISPWAKPMIKQFPKTRAEKGFTLIELLLSLSLGSMLFVVLLQLIGADLRLGNSMASRLRESAQQRQTLELIRGELAIGSGWEVDPTPSHHGPAAWLAVSPCSPLAWIPAIPGCLLKPLFTAWELRLQRFGAARC